MNGHSTFVAKDWPTDDDDASFGVTSWLSDAERSDTESDLSDGNELPPGDDLKALKEWSLDEIEGLYL